MKDIIRLLAKEVRRIRAIVEISKLYKGPTNRINYRKMELDTLKRILAVAIKKSLTFH